MKAMIYILLESSAAMILFYCIYWLFLRKETWFTANRIYLTGSLLLSVILPLFPLKYTVTVAAAEPVFLEAASDAFLRIKPIEEGMVFTDSGLNLFHVFLIVYFFGAAWVFMRLLVQTIRLVILAKRYGKPLEDNLYLVENNIYPIPFSFFRYIFIHPAIHSGSDLNDIITHEKVHILEHHWIDLLITEILCVVFWFNPFVWWFERSIKQNHEYLADEGVLAQGRNLGRYQALLINQLMGVPVIGIANHLNFALNKTRFKMMTKKKKSKLRAVRMALALPVIAALLMAFAKPVYRHSEVLPVENPMDQPGKTGKKVSMKVTGKVVKPDGTPLHGASVILLGTTTGTVANSNGLFSLEITGSGEQTLVISFVGYETVKYNLGSEKGEKSISIEMKEGLFHIDPDKHFQTPPPPPPPSLSSPPPPPAKNGTKSTGEVEEIFIVVEELPEYPGGLHALGKYIETGVKQLKGEKNLTGKVLLGFTVDEKGMVTDIKILESDSKAVSDAAVHIMKGMEPWKPGRQRGKAVPVNYSLPVEF